MMDNPLIWHTYLIVVVPSACVIVLVAILSLWSKVGKKSYRKMREEYDAGFEYAMNALHARCETVESLRNYVGNVGIATPYNDGIQAACTSYSHFKLALDSELRAREERRQAPNEEFR